MDSRGIRQDNGFFIKLMPEHALTFESFIGKTEEKLIMANGDSVFVTGDSNRTYVNGFQFTNSELAASNGTMLALKMCWLPPTQNLAAMMGNDTSLSFFNQAILLATPVPDTFIVTPFHRWTLYIACPSQRCIQITGL